MLEPGVSDKDILERLRGWLRMMDVAGHGPDADMTALRTKHITEAADEIERLRIQLWAMAANRAPKQPGDTHVEVFMPVELWKEVRP